MRYCARCLYPQNSKPSIIFDEQGVCSGCRLIESRQNINWQEREQWLKTLLESYKGKGIYDCIIPVSGGKDSHYQTYIIKEIYKLNPLLVTYNHTFNTPLGIRNLRNLVKQFKCDLVRFTTSPESAKKMARYGLKRVGDITLHYHAGIMTFPIQEAVRRKIPLMIWGEEGYSELVGMHNQDDMVEFTKKKRQEHSMRGLEPEDILQDELAIKEGITQKDLAPFYYPSNDEIETIGVRGIYLSNYINWNAKKQTEYMIKNYGFETAYSKDRTFNIYDKTDDIHASGTHDYLKYLKFGYGRCTDDASTEIRHGRMTREQGIKMVMKYDHVRPKDLDLFLEFAGMTEQEFENSIEHLRDPNIWGKTSGYLSSMGRIKPQWVTKDNIGNHINDAGVDRVEFKGGSKFALSSKETKSLNEQKEYVVL